MQKEVRLLPGTRAEIPEETSEHEAKDSKGAGGRGRISDNQLDYTAGAPTKFLKKIKFCNREEKNKKRHVNPSGGAGRFQYGTHDPGDS